MLFYPALMTMRGGKRISVSWPARTQSDRPADRLSWLRQPHRRWGGQSRRVDWTNERTSERRRRWRRRRRRRRRRRWRRRCSSRLRVPTPSSVGRLVGRSVGDIDFPPRHVWVCSRAHALTAHICIRVRKFTHTFAATTGTPRRAANPLAELRKVSPRRRRRVLPSSYISRWSSDLGRAQGRNQTSRVRSSSFVAVRAPVSRLSRGHRRGKVLLADGASTRRCHSHPAPRRLRGERVVSGWTWIHEDGVSVSPGFWRTSRRSGTAHHVGIQTSPGNRVALPSRNRRV